MKNCKVTCEIGINHSGDMNIAKKLIDIAVEGKYDYVKFQKRDINLVYTKEYLDSYRESPWGTTQKEQKEGLEFSLKDYKEIDRYCKQKNIKWYVSVWDVNSVDFIMQFDVPFIKIPSALITNIDLLHKIAGTKLPVIISCGMSTEQDIDLCLSILGAQVRYILSCTSSYPTPIEEMNMARIPTLQNLYAHLYKIGFSNHFKSIQFILQAYLMRCEMIEFHITLDRSMYGTDQSASIEPRGIYKIRDYIKDFEKGWGSGKIECQESEIPVKKKLRRIE